MFNQLPSCSQRGPEHQKMIDDIDKAAADREAKLKRDLKVVEEFRRYVRLEPQQSRR